MGQNQLRLQSEFLNLAELQKISSWHRFCCFFHNIFFLNCDKTSNARIKKKTGKYSRILIGIAVDFVNWPMNNKQDWSKHDCDSRTVLF